MAHIAVNLTLRGLHLTWHWADMTAGVRQIIRTFDVIQTEKYGVVCETRDRQRLFAGKPRQKYLIDLISPLPENQQGKKWILVIAEQTG